MTLDNTDPDGLDATAGFVPNLDEMLGFPRFEPAPPDVRRNRWIGWLEQIERDVSNLTVNRMVWKGLTAIWRTREPPLPSSLVFDVWAHTYAHTQASGVRRQADAHRRDVASLARLLSEIERHPDRVSLPFFVGRYEWGLQHLGHREFANLDTLGTGHIDPSIANTDREELKQVAEDVVRWVHENVAHLAEVPAQAVPTFDDLDQALDVIGRIYRRWNCILTGRDLVDLDPVPQYDWLAPFRVPWIFDSSSTGPEPG